MTVTTIKKLRAEHQKAYLKTEEAMGVYCSAGLKFDAEKRAKQLNRVDKSCNTLCKVKKAWQNAAKEQKEAWQDWEAAERKAWTRY